MSPPSPATAPTPPPQPQSSSGAGLLDQVQSGLLSVLTTASTQDAANAVNAVSQSVLQVVSALTTRGSLTSTQVYTTLNLTAALTSALTGAGSGYDSSATGIHNPAFDAVASVLDAVVVATASDSNQHCGFLTAVQGGLMALMTAGSQTHNDSNPDVSFSRASFSASTTRVSASTSAALVTVGGLGLTIPSSAFASAAGYLDIQRQVYSYDGSSWAGCYVTPNTTPDTSNVTDFALLPSPLALISVYTAAGSAVDISGLSTPLQFVLPFNFSDAAALTPTCAFLDTTTNQWSTTGCSSTIITAGVQCSCTHLTTFSVLGVTPTAGTDAGKAAAATTGTRPDLIGIFFLYLIPLVACAVLLVVLLYIRPNLVSQYSRLTYLVIGACALMRVIGVALLAFGNSDGVTTAFDQNALAIAATLLMVVPLLSELVLLVHLLYRYAVVRRKEGSSRLVQGEMNRRRASDFSSLVDGDRNRKETDARPPSGSMGRRRSTFVQRFSVITQQHINVTLPPSQVYPAVFAAVFLVATVPTVISYIYWAVKGSDAAPSIEILGAFTFAAAVLMLGCWVAFIYRSLPNMTGRMRQGQALGWVPYLAFALQSLLLVAFAGKSSPSWYFQTSASSGVHVMLVIYALVEIVSLTGSAVFWQWQIQWWRAQGKAENKGKVGHYIQESNDIQMVENGTAGKAGEQEPGEEGTGTYTAEGEMANDQMDAARPAPIST